MASRKGNYLGTMLSHGQRYRPARLRAQLALSGTPRELKLAASFVHAKITKQRIVLERSNRRPVHEEVAAASDNLAGLVRMLPDATTIAEVMGLEGAAARFSFRGRGAIGAGGAALRRADPPATAGRVQRGDLLPVHHLDG